MKEKTIRKLVKHLIDRGDVIIGVLAWGHTTGTSNLPGVVWNPKTFSFPMKKSVLGIGYENIVRNPAAERARLSGFLSKTLKDSQVIFGYD
jgi:hypothetical protein